MPELVTSPLWEKIANGAVDASAGAKGPVSVALPQPIGIYASMPFTVTAPVVESALPSSVSFGFIVIAALLAIIVPFIAVAEAILTRPSTFQKTLHATAPLISFTFEPALVEKLPCI